MRHFKRNNPEWCQCKWSSASSHSDKCINKDCYKYIPNGYEIAEVILKRLEQAVDLLDKISPTVSCDAVFGDECTACDLEDFVRIVKEEME